MLHSAHRLLLLSLPVVLLSGSAVAEEEPEAPTLVTKSPFLPPDFNPPGGAAGDPAMPASASQYEFRGVYEMGGRYYFNLYNTRDQEGTWIAEGESGGDAPRIVRFDRDDDILVVEVGGETVSLELADTSDRPMPVATAPRPATPTTLPATASQQSPTPVRRRVIRPSSRTTPTTTVRRPTVPPSNTQQQEP